MMKWEELWNSINPIFKYLSDLTTKNVWFMIGTIIILLLLFVIYLVFCFKGINVATQNGNHVLAMLLILLTGLLPGLIYYIFALGLKKPKKNGKKK